MAKRSWCNECGCYVTLTDDGLCPQGHPESELRWVEEVSDLDPAQLPAASSERGLGFGRKVTIALEAVLIVALLGFAWIGRSFLFGQTIRTAAGVKVTLPRGWEVASQKKERIVLSPKGRRDVTVEFDVLRDPYELVTNETLADDVLEARQTTGLAPDNVTWLGLSAIHYEEHLMSRAVARTEAWDGAYTTYRVDYRASDPFFDRYRAQAEGVISSIQVDK